MFTRYTAIRTIIKRLFTLEGDVGPWLTPYHLRGKIKVNEPAFVREVAEFISKTRHISFEKIADITIANARKFFNL